MTLELLQNSAEPLHQQLKSAILARIEEGEWSVDTQIDSERELCDRFGVSRTTARRAISDLIHEGILYTVSGKGTFVAERALRQELKPLVGFMQDLRDQGVEVTSKVLAFDRVEADEELAARLQVRPFSPVIELTRCRFAWGQAMAIQNAFLPEHLCPGILHFDFADRSLFDTLRSEFELDLVGSTTVIKSALASETEAATLGIAPPAALLRTYQTTFLGNGQVIEYCISSFNGDHFELTSGFGGQHTVGFNASYSGVTRDERPRREAPS